MKRISVIIPTFERGELFDECLQSVLESIAPQDEIIVINDSKKNRLHLKVSDERIRVFDNPKNGVASARNLGASHALGEYLLFIDDDMLINVTAIESCLSVLKENEPAVVNADWIYTPHELKRIQATSFGRYLERIKFTSLRGWCPDLEWKESNIIHANGVTSQFLLIQKSLFDSINGYNEGFSFAGFEDYDLGKRLEKKAVHFLINTRCCVFHNEKDRMTLIPFLERKRRGAFTRKKGVELGYSELHIHYSFFSQLLYSVLSFLSPIIVFMVNKTPNNEFWDNYYFRLVNRLIGIYIFKGYKKNS